VEPLADRLFTAPKPDWSATVPVAGVTKQMSKASEDACAPVQSQVTFEAKSQFTCNEVASRCIEDFPGNSRQALPTLLKLDN